MSQHQNTNEQLHSSAKPSETCADSVPVSDGAGTNATTVADEVTNGSDLTNLDTNSADPSPSGKNLDPRPRIKLSGDDRLTSVVASEYGHVLAASAPKR